jgi:integrase
VPIHPRLQGGAFSAPAGKDFTPHDFRHTCITNWRRKGHDYFKIMKASGHKTLAVFKRYDTVDEDDLKSLAVQEGIIDQNSEVGSPQV